ncbi:ComF family protein [Planococcus glaciei]|uniref:ComF family protein n=1 Tax=Planococcus glaciei TaxID=459472 RepID=UPI000AB28654|nr:ComF family protein [Planococcus glaciei]
MKCLLCDSTIVYSPTWQGLLLRNREEPVCKKCKAEFAEIKEPRCGICGLPGSTLCTDCSYWETTEYRGCIDAGMGLYQYNEAMKTFLHRYKFLQDVELSRVFAEEVKRSLRKPRGVVVPIPMHASKLRERTFSQVDRLLDAAEINYRHFLIKSNSTQGTKTKKERMAVENLFAWNGEAVPKKILLVDDLYTTGTTLRQAAKTLKDAGAEEIRVWTLIRS